MILRLHILFFFISLVQLTAQELQFTEFTRKDGLESNNITCIYQDHYGFIWVGTIDGLNRYDASRMITYKFSNEDTTSINDNYITAIREDAEHNLWIGTSSGINRYIREKDCFQRYKFQQENDNQHLSNGVRALLCDNRKNFWLCTGFGLKKLVKQDSGQYTFETYYPEPIFTDTSKKSEWAFLTIYEDQDNNLWTSTWGGGLMLFDPVHGTFKHFKRDPGNIRGLNSNIVTAVEELQDGKLLLGTYDRGINIFNPKDKTCINYLNTPRLKHQLDGQMNIISLCVDANERIWIGTTDGLYLVDQWENDQFSPIKGKITDDCVSDLLEDKAGRIWVASNRRMIKYDPERDKFSKYRVLFSEKGQKDYISDFAKHHDGTLFITTFNDGLVHCTADGKVIRRYLYPEIVSNDLNTVCIDTSGILWCGGIHGISRIDLKTGIIKNNTIAFDESRRNGLNEIVVNDITLDARANMWIATQFGIDVVDPETQQMIDYPLLKNIELNFVHGTLRDNKDNMIVYGDGGAILFSKDVSDIKYFKKARDDLQKGLCNNKVRACVQDYKGRYWFGTYGGISVYDVERNKFSHYFDHDGIASQIIRELVAYENQIWVKTENSVSLIDIEKQGITNYFSWNGLQLNGGTIWADNDGKIYVAGEGSFTSFYPQDIQNNPNEMPIYFTDLWINGIKVVPGQGNVLEHEMTYTDQITLNHNQQIIRLGFTALNYTFSNKSRYKYLLEGYGDTNWYTLGFQNELTLMNLAPGDYTLKIKGADANNVWNETPAVLNIKILSPWWKTWPAYVMFIVIFLVLTMFIVFLIIKRERKIAEKNKIKAINKMKIRFFTDISHELRTPLTLISSPLERLLKTIPFEPHIKSQVSLIHKNAQRMLKLVNQLLDFRKLDTGSYRLHVNNVEIVSFLRNIAEVFTLETDDKYIQIDFNASPSELRVDVDESVIEKIVANLLSNAIKHSPHGSTISLSIQYNEATGNVNKNKHSGILSISVSDEGKGIPDEEKHQIFNRFYRLDKNNEKGTVGSGIGLNLVKEMTRLHHGQIVIDDNKPRGTVFRVMIPVDEATVAIHAPNHEIIDFKQDEQADDNKIIEINPGKDVKKQTILWVEDSQEMRQYVSSILTEAGYHVIEAENGRDGYHKAQSELPDLIISDIMMPVEDGITLCQNSKTNSLTSHIPVILLSAKSGNNDVVEGLKHRADDYITKPFNAEILLTRVNNLIQVRDELKHVYRQRFFIADTKIQEPAFGDERFLLQIKNEIEGNLENSDFNVEMLVEKIGFSRAQLNRKLKALINLSPNELIRQIKMEKAKEMLMLNNDISIAELGYKLGFKTNAHFSRVFKEYFNKTPRAFLSGNDFVNIF